jgi:tripartite-type tricarboxylate transporter receptor subunit TctC
VSAPAFPPADPALHRRRLLALPAAALVSALWPASGASACDALAARAPAGRPAPAWPCRALHIVVAYPPGGISDQVARALAEAMAAQLGVPVVVENRAGASGTLALDLLARRRPDGTSLCFVAATALAVRDRAARQRGATVPSVVPIAGVMRTPVLVVGTRSLRAPTFAALVEQARAGTGGIRWATTGEGTTGHAVLDRVRRATGADIVHVPYKGGGQQLADALAGHFEVLSTNVAAAQLEDVAAGRLQALAVGAPRRLEVLPRTPTLAELGFPDANLDSLFGLFGPPDLPADRADLLHGSVVAALRSPRLQNRLRNMGNLPYEGDRQAFARQVAREAQR